MDMDVAMEEEFSGSSDQMMIVKRKRTKRSRQVSSLNMTIVTSSSSSDGDGDGGGDEIRFLIPSNSMCSEISTSTEEDEDMANCLILLAQSGSSSTQQMDQLEEVKVEKINSRRFTEMATTTGKAGIYVYECKTCNRSFPSFQALGGHRASHKKSKIAMVDEKKVSIISTSSNDHHPDNEEEKQREEEKFTKICSSPNISIQLPNIIKGSSNNCIKKGGKIHECSICGSEFSSGQALGGHMRRHRNIPTSNKGNNNIDTSTTTETSSHDAGERRRNILQLDLNLPAPIEDDHDHDHDSKFQFSTNQQKHVLFSSPAMVNCHY